MIIITAMKSKSKKQFYKSAWVQCGEYSQYFMVTMVAQTVKRLSTMRETWVRALGWEDPLAKETAIHSSASAWKIPRTEKPGRLQSMGSQRVRHN